MLNTYLMTTPRPKDSGQTDQGKSQFPAQGEHFRSLCSGQRRYLRAASGPSIGSVTQTFHCRKGQEEPVTRSPQDAAQRFPVSDPDTPHLHTAFGLF